MVSIGHGLEESPLAEQCEWRYGMGTIAVGLLSFCVLKGLLKLLAASLLAYDHAGQSWWTFAALILVPDLSMLGYLANAKDEQQV